MRAGFSLWMLLLSLDCWLAQPEMRIVNWGAASENPEQPHQQPNNDRYYPAGAGVEGSDRPLTVELSDNSPLSAQPGSTAILNFAVTNNSPEPFYLQVLVNDDKGFVSYVDPLSLFLQQGGRSDLRIQLAIPPQTQIGVQDKIQVTVRSSSPGPSHYAITASRRVIFAVGSQLVEDSTSPYCNYRYLSDCNGHTGSQYCTQRSWAVSVTMQDDQSGLRTIYSTPTGLQLTVPFEVGTVAAVTGTYRASCCNPRVHIQGTDIQGNVGSCIIDVSGIYLGAGEIVGIVIGAIVFIILVVLLIVCLVRRSRARKEEPVTIRERSHL